MIYLTNLGNQTRRCCLLNTYHICFFFFILDSILKLEIGYDYKAKRAECFLEALAVDGWKKKRICYPYIWLQCMKYCSYCKAFPIFR